jgi:hypothetical protein
MSVVKLLSRIVEPFELDSEGNSKKADEALNDHMYSITSDPLTQFGCVFSTLAHEVDHSGAPNTQLVKEGHYSATFYRSKR